MPRFTELWPERERADDKPFAVPGQWQAYQRGAEALASIARLSDQYDARGVRVLVPGYFCNESLEPLRRLGADLQFYPVTASLVPDWEQVRYLAEGSVSVLLIVVHYFGFPNDTSSAIGLFKDTHVQLIEDGAHLLRPMPSYQQVGATWMFSPHKLLAVPSIALLRQPQTVSISGGPPETNWQVSDLLRMLRRLVQKLMPIGPRLTTRQPALFGDVAELAEKWHESSVSRLAAGLLRRQLQQLDEVARRRRENYTRLLQQLYLDADGSAEPAFADWPEDAVPYVMPLKVREQHFDRLFSGLRRKGVPVQTWPDLPPEVAERPEQHRHALAWRKQVLLFPIHQSLNRRHIDYMAEQFVLLER